MLADRVTNAIEQYRSTQRAAQLERLHRVVKDANQALLRAETRSEIEQRICEVISDADPYLFAWFGEHDSDAQTVEPRAAAGIGEGYHDTIEITTDKQATAQGPTGQAVRTREIVVEQEIAESPEYVPWREWEGKIIQYDNAHDSDVGKHHRHAKDATGIEFTGLENHHEYLLNEVLQINDLRSVRP